MSDHGAELLPDHDRRKPRAVLLLLAGLSLGAGLMLGLLTLLHAIGNQNSMAAEDHQASRAGSSATPAAPRSQRPGVGAMGEMTTEQALRFHIPASIVRSCAGGDREHVSSFAYFSLVCHPGGQVSQVQYSSFHDAQALRAKFAHDMSAMRITGKPSPQTCATFRANAYGHWWMDPMTGRDGASVHRVAGVPSPGSTGGRLMCYWSGDQATIEWYDGDTHIYAWATTSQDLATQLFRWWARQAGPWHPRAEAPGM